MARSCSHAFNRPPSSGSSGISVAASVLRGSAGTRTPCGSGSRSSWESIPLGPEPRRAGRLSLCALGPEQSLTHMGAYCLCAK